MNYKLTKKQLENSAYYCGAGIDFQPILRLGDVVQDFIYVTVGLTESSFLDGVDKFITKIKENLEHNNSSLEFLYSKPISINEIEHTVSSRLIPKKPEYFSWDDFKEYQLAMKPFIQGKDDFYLELQFKLTIGTIEKEIRLFHLSGEALATYEMLFSRQDIAPKVFISIQTGLIEIPDLFSNKLFELSSTKPKIWLRGSWSGSDIQLQYLLDKRVFNECGVFNECIGEYRNWEVLNSDLINSNDNSNKKYRIVRAYGEKSFWDNLTKIQTINKKGLTINRILERFDHDTMSSNYNIVKRSFPLSCISEILSEATEFYYKNSNSLENIVKVCLVPGVYECFEAMIVPFFESFVVNLDWELQIDIYYISKSDFYREF